MDNFTFKNINEKELLTEVPENANVFVEVDGAMKRVPKSEVGGSKGYIIPVTMDNINTETNFNGVECTLNYDEVYEVLNAGGTVWVDISAMMASGASTMATAGLVPSAVSKFVVLVLNYQLTDIGLILTVCSAGSEFANILLPNGSHNVVA